MVVFYAVFPLAVYCTGNICLKHQQRACLKILKLVVIQCKRIVWLKRKAVGIIPFYIAPASKGWYIKKSYIEVVKRRHGSHSHKNDEIIFILEGRAEIEIYVKTKTGGPNTSVSYPKRINTWTTDCR